MTYLAIFAATVAIIILWSLYEWFQEPQKLDKPPVPQAKKSTPKKKRH